MSKYRSRLDLGVPDVRQPIPHRQTKIGYVNYGLPSCFNVDNDADLNWPNAAGETLSLEQEYQSYLKERLFPMDTDLVKYWEVSRSS